MAEMEVNCWDAFAFASGKDKHLCCVKFCRNHRIPGRLLCYRHKQGLWRLRNPMRSAYHNLKHHALARKIKFTLTFDQFKEVCDATGYLELKGNKAEDLHIDRVEANKGYSIDNIQVITCSENSKKGSYERWITLRSGRRVRLHEIGVGVPAPVAGREEEWEPPAWLDPNIDEPF